MVRDEVASDPFDDCTAPVFSPDGAHLACWTQTGGKQCIVVDGHAQPAYDDVNAAQFSPDGKHVAYTAKRGDNWYVMVDGQPVTTDFEVIDHDIHPAFSADNSLDFLATKGNVLYRIRWTP